MGKKGMSLDDKKQTVVKLMQEAKRPFTLKDIEKLAAKAGVVQNTVKDVVKELCDENVIDLDKIGSTNWFWCFPTKEAAALNAKVKILTERSKQLDSDITRLTERREELLKDRPMTDDRKSKLGQLESLKKQKAELETRLKEAKDSDPEETRKLEIQVKEARMGAERWTDNTWATIDWLKKSCNLSKQDANRQLQVKDDFDYPVFVKGKKN